MKMKMPEMKTKYQNRRRKSVGFYLQRFEKIVEKKSRSEIAALWLLSAMQQE